MGGTTLALATNRLTVIGANNTSISNLVTSTSTTGNILKQGAGILTLSNNNTFTGGTFIDQGTVSLTSAGALTYAGAVQLGSTGGTANAATLNLGATGGGQTLSSAVTVTSNNTGISRLLGATRAARIPCPGA